MTDFPTILYRCPGKWLANGFTFATRPANNEEEYAAALADGWWPTVPEAEKAFRNPAPVAAPPSPAPVPDVPPDDAPVTRAEIEQKAAELGIPVHHKHKDETILKKIEEALAAQEAPADVVDEA